MTRFILIIALIFASFNYGDELPVYNYDQNDRIESIEFEDGSRVEYKYKNTETTPSESATFDIEGKKIQQTSRPAARSMDPRGLVDFFNINISPADSGVAGRGEINDKIRVTYVNGVMNEIAHVDHASKVISQLFGGVNVHYIHNNTSGLIVDLIETIDVKFGFISDSAEALAELWREMIAEMGGVGRGGKIYHMAHSGGSMHTKAAAELMTPEELAMIEVVTYGAPFMVENPQFISVTNYVSKRDGVGLMGAALNPSAATIVGELEEGPPFVDHIFTDGTYLKLLHQNGQKFVSQYGYFE